ncbi:MAG: hypothetical protein ABIR46_03575 [Candidatus Saccharimonadales bacterium]
MSKHETTADHLRDIEEAVMNRFTRGRKTALQKYPFLFVILTTLGTILTLNGIQKLVDRIDWLIANPLLMLAIGLATLLLTGALYKKLG